MYIVASKFPSETFELWIIFVIFLGFSAKADNVDRK